MDNDNRKKSIKDVKLAPTKGVRRPGAARTGNASSGGNEQAAFRRAAVPPRRKMVENLKILCLRMKSWMLLCLPEKLLYTMI